MLVRQRIDLGLGGSPLCQLPLAVKRPADLDRLPVGACLRVLPLARLRGFGAENGRRRNFLRRKWLICQETFFQPLR